MIKDIALISKLLPDCEDRSVVTKYYFSVVPETAFLLFYEKNQVCLHKIKVLE